MNELWGESCVGVGPVEGQHHPLHQVALLLAEGQGGPLQDGGHHLKQLPGAGLVRLGVVDHLQQQGGDTQAQEAAEVGEGAVDPVEDGLDHLPLPGVPAAEETEEAAGELLVDDGLEAVGLEVGVLEDGQEEVIDQVEVGPGGSSPPVLLLEGAVIRRSGQAPEDVRRHHVHHVREERPAEAGEVLLGEVQELFQCGRLPVPPCLLLLVLEAARESVEDTGQGQLPGQHLLPLLPLPDVLEETKFDPIPSIFQ